MTTMTKWMTGKAGKGEIGYFAKEKKRRLLITLLLFAAPLGIFFLAWIQLKSRETIWTVAAAVGCLPGCRSMVGLIMMWMRKPMDQNVYQEISKVQGRLCMAYELYMTFYEKSAYFDAFAVCGKNLVLYTPQENIDTAYFTRQIEDNLKTAGYRQDVFITTSKKTFLERLAQLNEKYETFESQIRPRPDERYPNLERDEVIRAILLDLCL